MDYEVCKSRLLFTGMTIHLRILPADSSESAAYKISRKARIQWSTVNMPNFSGVVVLHGAHLPNNKGVEGIQG